MRQAVVLALAATWLGCSHPDKSVVRVAAAADLARAFGELGPAFTKQSGIAVQFDFGSSGLLAKQIADGAPYSLFAAANRAYVDQVVTAGVCDGATIAAYARGSLVVWTPATIAPPTTLAELADPRFRRIAIANPDHAPYGVAAQQALTAAGVWPQLADRVVLGEDIQATLQFARTGNVDAAIVARSLATVTQGGHAMPVDPKLHAPIDQSLVVCGHGAAADAAARFAAFVMSQRGQDVLERYGFATPIHTHGGAVGGAP